MLSDDIQSSHFNIIDTSVSDPTNILPGNPPGLEGHDPVVEHVQEGEVTTKAIGVIFYIKRPPCLTSS